MQELQHSFFPCCTREEKINATHKCHPSCWCLISIQVVSNVCKPKNDPYTNNEHIHKIQSQSQKLFLTLAHLCMEKRLKIPTVFSQKICYVFATISKNIKRSFIVEIRRQFLYIIIISVFLRVSILFRTFSCCISAINVILPVYTSVWPPILEDRKESGYLWSFVSLVVVLQFLLCAAMDNYNKKLN